MCIRDRSCYEQKLLCDNLEQKLSHINYQRKNKENEKKEFKKFGWIDYIAGAIGWGICVVPPLIGEYYGAAEPPVRCGESHLSGLTEPPYFVY